MRLALGTRCSSFRDAATGLGCERWVLVSLDRVGVSVYAWGVEEAGMSRLESERVVVSAPMSFAGSARRLSAGLWSQRGVAARVVIGWWLLPVAVVTVWLLVAAWYVVFGLLLFPYRLVRRGSRKRKRDELRHREVLDRQ